MKWIMANIENPQLRKSVSHVGGHLADYMNTEMVCRSGTWQKKYIVVYNAAYAEIYEKYRSQLIRRPSPGGGIRRSLRR